MAKKTSRRGTETPRYKLTITITDQPSGGAAIKMDFDPPVDTTSQAVQTQATYLAGKFIEMVGKLGSEK